MSRNFNLQRAWTVELNFNNFLSDIFCCYVAYFCAVIHFDFLLVSFVFALVTTKAKK